jgi:glycosyltransferase involved in cell wall biosynthesis
MWLLHQHRTAYDLWESPMADLPHFPNGSEVRVAIQQADRSLMPEAKSFFTISRNVSHRLKKFCAVDSTPLYHPPKNAEAFRCGQAENYVFFPSRLSPIKRQALVIEALAQTRQPVRVRFAGTGDHPAYEDQLRQLAVRHQVHTRVEWMGQITEEEKIQQFAHALGVVYPPIDEDYGYVTLEAMLSSKPVITCADSGGTLEFVRQHETGLIAEPSPVSLAAALDELWENRNLAARWGATGRAYYDSMNINWTDVVRRLVS